MVKINRSSYIFYEEPGTSSLTDETVMNLITQDLKICCEFQNTHNKLSYLDCIYKPHKFDGVQQHKYKGFLRVKSLFT